jgi:hypothetical protein
VIFCLPSSDSYLVSAQRTELYSLFLRLFVGSPTKGMDGCSLNDAFPSGPYGSADCSDTRSAEISRKQEKKKARRCRGPALTYLNSGMNMVGAVDPDRPAVRPMPDVPQMNPKTEMYEHAPVTQQYNYETFVGEMDSLPEIRKNVAGPTALQSGESPSFFGASPDDGVGARNTFVESFVSSSAPFVNIIGDDETYRLKPDFASSFDSTGAQRASGLATVIGPSSTKQETSYLTPTSLKPSSVLPIPNTDMFWKDRAAAGGQSSFFAHLRAPGGLPAGEAVDMDAAEDVPASRKEVLTKLDAIFARLDDMESVKSENSQTEVLLFILTGLGVIFLMDIGCRAAVAGR